MKQGDKRLVSCSEGPVPLLQSTVEVADYAIEKRY